jgi:hypothetical protein
LCTHVYQKEKRKKKNLPGSSHRPGKSPSCETKHSGGGSVLCTAHVYFLLIRLNIECIKGIHRRGKRLVLFERFTNRLRHKKNPDGISSLHVDLHPPPLQSRAACSREVEYVNWTTFGPVCIVWTGVQTP